jgi:hypothetical protein
MTSPGFPITRRMWPLVLTALLAGIVLFTGCTQVDYDPDWNVGSFYYATSFVNLDGGTMTAYRSRDGFLFTLVGSYFDASLSDPFSIHIGSNWWLVYSETYNHLYPALTLGIAKSVDGGVTYAKQKDLAPSETPSCYEVGTPKFVINPDGSAFSDAQGYHMFFECFQDQSFNHIDFYEIHSTDMVTWSSPANSLVGANFPASMQNPFCVAMNGNFYLWYKNEQLSTIEYATSKSLLGPYTVTKSGDWAGWGSTWDSESLVMIGPNTWIIYLTNPMVYSQSTDNWATWSAPRRIYPDGLRNGNVTLFNQ